MPTLTIIAGPNGAGKSTITRLVGFEDLDLLLDPDAIARRLKPENPAAAAIAAGREVLRRQAEFFRSGISFAVETTLAGSRVNLADEAKQNGFSVNLLYVGVNTPERSISRGRYRDLWPRVNSAAFFDNSGPEHRHVLTAQNGQITFRVPDLPPWLSGWGI